MIIREIGRGAMGVVYKAHDPVIEREVAIKAIQIAFEVPPDEKDIYLSRFFREAKAAGKLSHPNIVTIFDVDEDPDTKTPFIVMEFLEGTNVFEVITSGILLPLEDVNNMIIQLADALNYAHSEGVIHRDVKAANILILPAMKVKIMDFGIARLPSSDLTQSGQFIGTPNYMSPEQIEGKTQVDGRSDLFSLGVIFYMLLTGERPFPGDTFNTVSYKIVHGQHLPPRDLNPHVPDAYNGIISKLLAKNPADRYQSGAELILDIKKLMSRMNPIEELSEEAMATGGSGAAVLSQAEGGSPVKPPPLLPIGSERADLHNPAVDRTASPKRLASLGFMIVLVAVLTFGTIYFIRASSEQKQQDLVKATSVPNQPNPVAEMSRQNAIRIKWDLAMTYVESNSHDQAIKELNDILKLDPQNQDARKFLALVVEKKEIEQQKKLEPPPPVPEEPVEKVRSKAVEPKVVTPVEVPPAIPEIKTASVEFEFEHGFPSGIFYIFANDKLAFEGDLSGEKRKVLIFQNYKGKLAGSLELPVGETNLLVHVVCREKGVSASKRITVKVQENKQYNLQIKYLKTPKQLELSWT